MKKIHALSLATILLLAPFAPVSDNLPLASTAHAAAQQDTIKEYTRPAKTSEDKDEERSVEAPVPWLIVEDHRIETRNANGKCVTYSSHPVLRVNGEGRPLLAHGLDTWSKQEAQAAKKGFDTFSWYMSTRGELVFLYPPYALGPYSSGDFTFTIERADAPELFTDVYLYEGVGTSLVFYTDQEDTINKIHLMENLF